MVVVLQASYGFRRRSEGYHLRSTQPLLRRHGLRTFQPICPILCLPSEARFQASKGGRWALVVVVRNLLPLPILHMVPSRPERLRLFQDGPRVPPGEQYRAKSPTRSGEYPNLSLLIQDNRG